VNAGHEETPLKPNDPGRDDTTGTPDQAGAPDEGAPAQDPAETARPQQAPGAAGDAALDEIDIIREELAALQAKLEDAESRALRARAELDTVKRRTAGDVARARDAGVDEALAPAMAVFDDLRRALDAAEQGDPASIVPGVKAVLETLGRNLDGLGVERVGHEGEPFDAEQHEALTTAPLQDGAEPGTIATVFEAGFKRGERLIRPARVVVYQDAD